MCKSFLFFPFISVTLDNCKAVLYRKSLNAALAAKLGSRWEFRAALVTVLGHFVLVIRVSGVFHQRVLALSTYVIGTLSVTGILAI